MPTQLSIDELGPTQLYLSSEKLVAIAGWFDFEAPNYGDLPVFEYDGEWYLSDGHTRAFLASLAGVDRFRVERDPSVREEYDFDVYRNCIEWCVQENVLTIADLRGRIVSPETNQEVWIARCQTAAGPTGSKTGG